MTSKNPQPAPSWNLSGLYRSLDDPRLAADLRKSNRAVKAFNRSYRGKVAIRARRVEGLREMLEAYERLLAAIAKPLEFAQLLFAASSADPRRRSFLQRMQAEHTRLYGQLLFFELELTAVKDALLRRHARAPELKRLSNYICKLLAEKPYRLSEREEQLMNDKQLTGRRAIIRLFNEELALKKFTLRRGRRRSEHSETELLDMLLRPERDVREQAARALTEGLKEEQRRLVFIFNTLVIDKSTDDRFRRFPQPESARHLANQIEHEDVAVMAAEVERGYAVVQDYYRFKGKLLGRRLYHYDRFAPISGSRKNYPFPEARRMVLDAFNSFSSECGGLAGEFFRRRWIDAALRPGKRGGAFCTFVTPDLHPYVLLNYNGSLRDVFTLAHELGHGVHACLMRGAGYLNFEVPLTVCETASVFSEMLLFQQLKESIGNRRRRLQMYTMLVENIIATVFRQIALFRFEQDLHRQCRERGELPVETINHLWRRRQQEMFGDTIVMTGDYDYWWSYISHFVHAPFYVYAYAFGELLTLALYARYRSEGKPFVQQFLNVLRAGDSRNPRELLRPLGVDLSSRQFWRGGIKLIGELVEETKGLA